ncbi:MAG: hypothetical protein TR69_WS6001000361 [candidate division WS6 bacterium OLB20]|uniref:Uncharacterized protein n=1 Tax=candidate division WS6 bacterium OLB20 TaxID=1617426 RepID=A0A136M0R3_9BACT|nr:MAG: hypothetical protein TR69_WS6001000361 [candidate division WS6 bacterium OLB20]
MEPRESYRPQLNQQMLRALLLALIAALVASGKADAQSLDPGSYLNALPDFMYPPAEPCIYNPGGTALHHSVIPDIGGITNAVQVDQLDEQWFPSVDRFRSTFEPGSASRANIEEAINLADPDGRLIQSMGYTTVADYVSNIWIIPGHEDGNTVNVDTIINGRHSWGTTLQLYNCTISSFGPRMNTNVIAFSSDSVNSRNGQYVYESFIAEEALQSVTFYSDVLKAQLQGFSAEAFFEEWTNGHIRLQHELIDAIFLHEAYGSSLNSLAASGYQIYAGRLSSGRQLDGTVPDLATELITITGLNTDDARAHGININSPLEFAQAMTDPVTAVFVDAYVIHRTGMPVAGHLYGKRTNNGFDVGQYDPAPIGPNQLQLYLMLYGPAAEGEIASPTPELIPTLTQTATLTQVPTLEPSATLSATPSPTPTYTDVPTETATVVTPEPADTEEPASPAPSITPEASITPVLTSTEEMQATLVATILAASPESTPTIVVSDTGMEVTGTDEQSGTALTALLCLVGLAGLMAAAGGAILIKDLRRTKARPARQQRSTQRSEVRQNARVNRRQAEDYDSRLKRIKQKRDRRL